MTTPPPDEARQALRAVADGGRHPPRRGADRPAGPGWMGVLCGLAFAVGGPVWQAWVLKRQTGA